MLLLRSMEDQIMPQLIVKGYGRNVNSQGGGGHAHIKRTRVLFI